MGAKLRVVRRRIKSVQSTMKITRAMELIAASRIMKAQQRVEPAQGALDAVLESSEMGQCARRCARPLDSDGQDQERTDDRSGLGRRRARGAWLDAGARELVVEARESAKGVGLFDEAGNFSSGLADRFANAFGLDMVTFEAPNKPSQFALLDHFGPQVRLCNVRLEELLRVEIYRRGLHSDAFCMENLRPHLVTEEVLRAS
jgi:phosphosulfolactate synthase (CoM biosynthesis protein A)